ncbi:EcWRKY-25, partial [Eragrostis curvula]
MAACLPDDRESAVSEVAKAYELIKTHQPLLLLHHHGQEPTKLAQNLLSEALRALNIALSVMKQPQKQHESSNAVASPQLSSSSPASTEAADSKGATSTSARRSGKRRRYLSIDVLVSVIEGRNSSWINLTTAPYEDGYEWRKYGEKRINGTHFTKSYFRCTYKDDKGCPSTKYIQQKDNDDPPVFEVTYNHEHTCNCTSTASPAKKSNCNDDGLPTGGAVSPPNNGHVMIKQEATVVLPSLADVPAVPLDDHHQMPHEESFPIVAAAPYRHVSILSPSATSVGDSSCLTGVSCDELEMGRIMMEPLMGDDPELQDLELFLLYDSFKYY